MVTVATGCVETQKVDPEGSEKQYQLAAQLFHQKQQRAALEELLKAVKMNPLNADAYYLLGIIALQQASEGEELLERQNCLRGEEGKLLRAEVDVKHTEAEGYFRKVVEMKPDISEAWNSLAVVDLYFHRWDQAIASADKALASPIYQQPWAAQGNLGWAYAQKKEYARASKEFRQALFANPQFCVGRYRLARSYFEAKNFDSAVEELEKVTSDPKCPIQEAYHLLGLVSLMREDRTRATAAFRRCQEMAPKSCLARECGTAVN
ncbi:MAG: tetratricopeptide repeat protein [Myxococcales bacterium]|nr:tetratricopeptide repeat protein [Myxococcales bacterium]